MPGVFAFDGILFFQRPGSRITLQTIQVQMLMHILENETIAIRINPKGAELDSIYHKQHQIEYLWQADPAFWAKKSPVLFPIVGGLKSNTYFFDQQPYTLTRHGFARDQVFEITDRQANSVRFSLKPTREILDHHYPFVFEFAIRYLLTDNKLTVTYEVKNATSEIMYFSVGGHPAFNVPLVSGTAYEDYHLQLDKQEDLHTWPLTADGLVEDEPEPFLGVTDTIPLKKSLFYNDALVFKHLQSTRIALRSAKTNHGLAMDFTDFPFFGIWAAKDADFVCLEPWCGIADAAGTDQQLIHKEGIEQVQPQSDWKKHWQLTLW
jgi:galactose mutarotase-like enzyme